MKKKENHTGLLYTVQCTVTLIWEAKFTNHNLRVSQEGLIFGLKFLQKMYYILNCMAREKTLT